MFRSRHRAGRLDCLRSLDTSDLDGSLAEVSALSCRDGLTLGVGTSSGHVQLFDLRSPKALLVKDHMYGLPVKRIAFHRTHDQVMSLDAKCVKIWDRQTGQPYATIESEHELNDLVAYQNSGLLFLANEQPRMQAHFIPSLGPAPNWCSFLDTMTEEMDEDDVTEVYDDYKFITKERLVDLGLEHLIGSPLLRAYTHGFFMDVHLYKKAEALEKPTTSLVESNIRKKVEEARKKRVELKQKLPTVNKDLYLKLKDLEGRDNRKKKHQQGASLLQDERFQEMFKDDRFTIDTTEEAYRLLNPVLSKLDESKLKKLEEQYDRVVEEESSEEEEQSVEDDIYEDSESSGSESDKGKRAKGSSKAAKKTDKVSFYELKDGFLADSKGKNCKDSKVPLEKRLAGAEETRSVNSGLQMSFSQESKKQIQERLVKKAHLKERASVRRSTKGLKGKKKGLR